MSDAPVLGIDLGTTFSAVGYVDAHGAPIVVSNPLGSRTTPSVIYFESDGQPVVGEGARNQALAEPERVIRFVKREMGNSSYRFDLDGTEWVPEALSALILKQLITDAEAKVGVRSSSAVITVPAYFKDSQRAATAAAAEIAGLETVHTINEPTAAAIAYGAQRADVDRTLLVYDFGGGTFDVTLLRSEGRHFTVLATDGDSHLGGIDVDAALVDHLADRFVEAHRVDLREDLTSRLDLWERAEQAKISLAARRNVTVVLSGAGATMRVDLDRDELAAVARPFVDRTRSCVERAMADVDLDWPAIDAVLLVGGSSLLPSVREMVDGWGRPVPGDVKVNEAVVIGAALRAALPDITESSDQSRVPGRGSTSPAPDVQVTDVASHSLGVRAYDASGLPVNSIIIPRLTQLPCSMSRSYRTAVDQQERFEVVVLQGEDRDANAPTVELVGKLVMDGLPPRPAGGVVVEVSLGYTGDGVVEVSARETVGGAVMRQSLMTKAGSLDRAVLDEYRQLVQDDVPAAAEETPQDEPDFYALIDVAPTATDDEVAVALDKARETFTELASTSGSAQAADDPAWMLRALADAEAVLKDPTRRRAYDARRDGQHPSSGDADTELEPVGRE